MRGRRKVGGIRVQEPRNEGGSGIWDRKDVGSLLESPEKRHVIGTKAGIEFLEA